MAALLSETLLWKMNQQEENEVTDTSLLETLLSSTCTLTLRCVSRCIVFCFSRESGRLHRGAFVLQQPGGGGESLDASTHERLSFQERDGNLQLQLLQLHPRRSPQPTGRRAVTSSAWFCGNASSSSVVRLAVTC